MSTLSIANVMDSLRAAGLSLVLTPECALQVRPASRLTSGQRCLIRDNKQLLVDFLRIEAANDNWNVHIPPGTSVETMIRFRAASRRLDASQAYYDHHVNCPFCIAAGRGKRYGDRCQEGSALWSAYQPPNNHRDVLAIRTSVSGAPSTAPILI